MTTTYEDYRVIKAVDDAATRNGMRMVPSKFGSNLMALIPDGDSLPIYSRDAELVCGTVDDLGYVLRGWEIAKMYHQSLGLISPEKIAKKENLYLQDLVAKKLKTGTTGIGDK